MVALSLLSAFESTESTSAYTSSWLWRKSSLLLKLLRMLNRKLIMIIRYFYFLLRITIMLNCRILILKSVHLLDRVRTGIHRFFFLVIWPYSMLILVMAQFIWVYWLSKIMRSYLFWVSQFTVSIFEGIWIGFKHFWLIFIVRSYKTWSAKITVENLRIIQEILNTDYFYSSLSINGVCICWIRWNHRLAINLYRNIISMSVILSVMLNYWNISLWE